MERYSNFGNFINMKRLERKITLREMARRLDCSAAFLSDVEKDRRNPFDMKKLELLSSILVLSEKEKMEMFDLAGKKRNSVAPDLPEYIMEKDLVRVALRKARDTNASDQKWERIIKILDDREED